MKRTLFLILIMSNWMYASNEMEMKEQNPRMGVVASFKDMSVITRCDDEMICLIDRLNRTTGPYKALDLLVYKKTIRYTGTMTCIAPKLTDAILIDAHYTDAAIQNIAGAIDDILKQHPDSYFVPVGHLTSLVSSR